MTATYEGGGIHPRGRGGSPPLSPKFGRRGEREGGGGGGGSRPSQIWLERGGMVVVVAAPCSGRVAPVISPSSPSPS